MADAPTDVPEKPPEERKSFIQKLGAAIPVALTALATTLAGMSTGALSQSMYWRSTAAQDQAKVNDQWAFAQAKRVRAQICYASKRSLEGIAGSQSLPKVPRTATPASLKAITDWLDTAKPKPVPAPGTAAPPNDAKKPDPPKEVKPPVENEEIAAVLQALIERSSEEDVAKLARKVKASVLEHVIADATRDSLLIEDNWVPEREAARKLATERLESLGKLADGDPERAKGMARVMAARAVEDDVDDRRYRAESAMNFWVGYLYEVRVKASTATSDSHLRRSQNFFVAMLLAQIGSVLASLAMNRKNGGLSVAAIALGLGAIGFGAYVFLTM